MYGTFKIRTSITAHEQRRLVQCNMLEKLNTIAVGLNLLGHLMNVPFRIAILVTNYMLLVAVEFFFVYKQGCRNPGGMYPPQ